MTYTVVLTRRAERDIEATASWWAAHRSAEQASRWEAGLEVQLQSLRTSPFKCPLAAEHSQFGYEVRELRYGLGRRPTHRAIFTVAEGLVIVLAVRHLAQDHLRPADVE